ncbi:MAG TPA: hypothetical protein VGV87_23595 [Blastocatellia bacterium]|jgi:hypothetical protein|nr:hypothetical protein [Blastocatellia bacterium]
MAQEWTRGEYVIGKALPECLQGGVAKKSEQLNPTNYAIQLT